LAIATSGTTYGVYGQSNSTDGYGVYSEGNSKVDGDLEITGALKGNIGPNGGAPFPRPAYDSGWVPIDAGTNVHLTHNLGGNVDNYVVDMQFRAPSGWGRNVHCFGGGDYAGGQRGANWYDLTSTDIEVGRGLEDYNAPEVRIRIWVYN
jgi:hypothetical protein